MIKNLHPLCAFVYFFCVISSPLIIFNPYISTASVVCASLLLIVFRGTKAIKQIVCSVILLLIIALTNPLFSHNGATVLFFINDTRITLEALWYGAVFASALMSAVLWFGCFNTVFDSEKLIYLLGRPFPKAALVFSMALSFIPRFLRDFKALNSASAEKRRLRRYLSSLSAVITRSMENSIITSDSMNARGYSLKGRTFFTRFRFTFYDGAYLLIFTALYILSMIFGGGAVFYPFFSAECGFGDFAYAVLAVIPFIVEVKEALRWKYSLSKI